MLTLYVPSMGRAGKIRTISNLPDALQARAFVVAPPAEVTAYRATLPAHVNVVSDGGARGIAKVRQRIIERHDTAKLGTKIAMLDDDLKFDTRRKDDPTKFKSSTLREISQLFVALERALTKHAHAGIAAREGGNRRVEPELRCTRMLRVLAYDVDVLRKERVRYDRCPVMEDFDVTLQLLRKGYPNALVNTHVQGQVQSNAPGGCSTYRTLEVQAQGATLLKKLHPDFVSVVEKTTKTAWGGATRTDVVIQWARAFASAK